MTIQIVVAGAAGRMGREVAAAAAELPDVNVRGGLLRPGSAAGNGWRDIPGLPIKGAVLEGDPRPLLAGAGALIDFSTPAGAVGYAQACATVGLPFVSGTTGLSAADLDVLRLAARQIPVFYARNMSLGIAALLAALPAIAIALDGFDVEIVETHHRHKVDAPSGTALAIAEAVAGDELRSPGRPLCFGRQGTAPREAGEIGLHAVRAGGNPGEHQVIFVNDGEEVRLSHRSFSRRAYALGALRAAAFVANQPPGWYEPRDFLRAAATTTP